jgi:hypothetical protein
MVQLESRQWTNLNNLYFAHSWLNYTILKVVADDTLSKVKAHAAKQESQVTETRHDLQTKIV